MCFRPAGVDDEKQKEIVCPKCGKKINPMGGLTLKKCPYCKIDFTQHKDKPRPAPSHKPTTTFETLKAPQPPKTPMPPIAHKQ